MRQDFGPPAHPKQEVLGLRTLHMDKANAYRATQRMHPRPPPSFSEKILKSQRIFASGWLSQDVVRKRPRTPRPPGDRSPMRLFGQVAAIRNSRVSEARASVLADSPNTQQNHTFDTSFWGKGNSKSPKTRRGWISGQKGPPMLAR